MVGEEKENGKAEAEEEEEGDDDGSKCTPRPHSPHISCVVTRLPLTVVPQSHRR